MGGLTRVTKAADGQAREEVAADSEPADSEPADWQPDSSQNNDFDAPAAAAVYAFCLEHRITLHVLGRDAVPMLPMALANRFAAEHHSPMMNYLRDCQQLGLVDLWGKVCAGGVLPPRCDREWFFATFCGVGSAEFCAKYADEGASCHIADFLNGCVKPYDVVAFMTLLPEQASAFDFAAARTVVKGHEHFFFMAPSQAPPVESVSAFLASAFEAVVRREEATADECEALRSTSYAYD